MKPSDFPRSLLHHIHHQILDAVHYIRHCHVRYILHQHLSINQMNNDKRLFSQIPVRASVFWYLGILHMLQVVRRAQLIFPQLNTKKKWIGFEGKWKSHLLHIQSSGENSPPLFSAAFFPIDAMSFELDLGFRLSDAIPIERNTNLRLENRHLQRWEPRSSWGLRRRSRDDRPYESRSRS